MFAEVPKEVTIGITSFMEGKQIMTSKLFLTLECFSFALLFEVAQISTAQGILKLLINMYIQ